MLKKAKIAVLRIAGSTGLTRLAMRSTWRRNRLLILAYHGTSIDDEHQWDSSLYLPPATLRARLNLIRTAGCNVLPLDTAVRLLYRSELPPRSVVLTFDDGPHDFYTQAFPIVRSFGFPVTVYLTTYYAAHNRPVYDVMLRYLLWKSRHPTLCWPEVLGTEAEVPLSGSASPSVLERLQRHPGEHSLTGAQKDSLLCRLAELLEVDYQAILRKRLLHIMSLDEVRELAAQGVDFQLHTHRHGVSLYKAVFQREIADNRALLKTAGSLAARHFCYPGGVHRPQFLPWLREWDIASATTCELGLASRQCDALLLPRLVDTGSLTEHEFVGWLSGVAALLPKRPYVEGPGQFLEERLGSGCLVGLT